MDKDIKIKLSNSQAANGKDWAMTRVMADYARTKPQKNLTPIVIDPATRQTHLALAIAPAWGVLFPPYNLARLTAVARSAGYKTSVFDVNVKTYKQLSGKLDFNAWDANREWMWIGRWYFKELRTHVEPVLEEYVKRIVQARPDIVGFSMYYTNEQATNWMAIQIRRQLPNVRIIVGGPQASEMNLISTNFYDHIVHGEGEQVLLDVLHHIEQHEPIGSKILSRNITSRLDLDSLPFPDYSDYDMSDYVHPGGMSAEISRGCIAKCVFCTEVHFWKYRGRLSNNLLNEIQHQHDTYGLDFVWFIDSLVNGNLNELRAFCLGVVERGLQITWQGYARCDGRMDLEYFRDLRKSGCIQLSYGIESGSQTVLDAMKKEITLDEIEHNLRDAALVGIEAHTNWIIGFPNEDAQAFAEATLSYDGKKMIYCSVKDGDLDLYVMDLKTKKEIRVTNTLGYDGGAWFSPDGKKIVWRASRPSTAAEVEEYKALLKEGLVAPTQMEVWIANADGTDAKQITHLGQANWAPNFTPDGKHIIFCSNHEYKRGFPFNMYLIDLEGNNLEKISRDKGFDAFPMFSPDGKRILFSSNRNNGGSRDTNLFVADWVD